MIGKNFAGLLVFINMQKVLPYKLIYNTFNVAGGVLC